MSLYDVVIVGAGPAGSAAGALLAQQGLRVALLERERFPRFRIGESLLPYANPILRELGIWEELGEAGFMPKLGAEFVLSNSTLLQRFWFSDNLPPGFEQTFQVERARFDALLLGQAERFGCRILCPANACGVFLARDSVKVLYKKDPEETEEEILGKYLLDASGRDSWLARKLGLPKEEVKLPKRCAVYAHFAGVYRNPGKAAGHITIVRLPEGWAWFIPLDSVKTSVGLVQTVEVFSRFGRSPEPFFSKVIREHKELASRMACAERLSPFYVTADYSYRYRKIAGDRWLLLGDASGFIDPIFSSGVTIALRTAKLASRWVARAYTQGARSLSFREQSRYNRAVHRMTGTFYEMIRMFYDSKSFEVFMVPSPPLGLRRAVLNLLAGNTDVSFSLWWRVRLFYIICRLNHWWPLVPKLSYS